MIFFKFSKNIFIADPPAFVQVFRSRCIYWQESHLQRRSSMMEARQTTGDVDDLIFQDHWLTSDR